MLRTLLLPKVKWYKLVNTRKISKQEGCAVTQVRHINQNKYQRRVILTVRKLGKPESCNKCNKTSRVQKTSFSTSFCPRLIS